MPQRKTGAFRCIAFCRAGAGRSRPDRFQRNTRATSAEPERKIKLPGGGLAGAAEDPALLLFAGLRRETPDRPPPGVPQGVFPRGRAGMELRPRQAWANTGLREVYIMPALCKTESRGAGKARPGAVCALLRCIAQACTRRNFRAASHNA